MLKSTTYQIPINEFESAMCKEAAKEKKNEILELFTNHNEIRTSEKFENIKVLMQQACSQGDLELLEIYLNKEIEIDTEIGRLTFKINKSNKTASLFKVLESLDNLIVPRNIEHEGEDYLVTSIIGSCTSYKKLKKIEFPSNSEVRTIYEKSFYRSDVESISFPPSLMELKEGWCFGASKLTTITVSESNDRFLMKDGKYLLFKSEEEKEEFDILLFANRNIKEAEIPSNIKIISSCAFYNCKQLSKVEISPNSNLQTIGSYAFSNTNITQIFIPSTVSTICEGSFYNCKQLSKVDISPNSNLQTIGAYAFSNTNITQFYIPPRLIELKERWCNDSKKLTKITVSESNNRFLMKDDKYLLFKSEEENEEFDILLFSHKNIEEAQIPSNIKIISSYAFYHFELLSKVEILPNSNLRTIGEHAFSYTNITEIFIPPTVSKICDNAFFNCSRLSKVEISPNSNLQIIGKHAFSYTNITQIFIPSTVLKISNQAFFLCNQLSKVEISPNSKLQTIGTNAFAHTKIEQIFIPSTVSMISDYAFAFCKQLSKFEISPNSNLQTIGGSVFVYTNITHIFIPSKLIELKEGWCYGASKLTTITVSESNDRFLMKDNKYLLFKSEEENEEFDILLYVHKYIEEAQIPSNIKIISSNAFYNCELLSKVEILPNSNLRTIGEHAFSYKNITEIFIPPTVSKICDNAFYKCNQLSKVEISPNSNLQIIGKHAFELTNITQIFIPSSVSKICESAFSDCKKLSKVEISPDSNLQAIGIYAFASTNITQIYIPSNISELCANTLYCCINLQILEISEESKLQSLDSNIFGYGVPEKIIIMIPHDIQKTIKIIVDSNN